MTLLCMELSSTWTNCWAAALNKARSATSEVAREKNTQKFLVDSARLEIEMMEILKSGKKKQELSRQSLAILRYQFSNFIERY